VKDEGVRRIGTGPGRGDGSMLYGALDPLVV